MWEYIFVYIRHIPYLLFLQCLHKKTCLSLIQYFYVILSVRLQSINGTMNILTNSSNGAQDYQWIWNRNIIINEDMGIEIIDIH